MSIRIAIDAMGGDHAPDVVIEGALAAAERFSDEVTVILVGPEDDVRKRILDEVASGGARVGSGDAGRNGADDGQPEGDAEGGDADESAESAADPELPKGIEIVNADQVIEMGEAPAVALKSKPNSSIHVGLGLVAKGLANGFVSAGNTGAIMAASIFVTGRVDGVMRPSIAAYYPTSKGFSLVLDVGANVECKPEHLVQFAKMGKVYLERVHQREDPTIGLMNIGEEPSKGNELVKEAYKLLRTDPELNFVGNIEGRDLMAHGADVVVFDGFVGNIVLKLGESVASILMGMLKAEVESRKLTWDERATVAKVVGSVKKRFDYEEFGGAPLLGIRGNVLIGHGGSTAKAIEHLIAAGAEMARQQLATSIAEAFAPAGSSEVSGAEASAGSESE